jgi:hypothetical protein
MLILSFRPVGLSLVVLLGAGSLSAQAPSCIALGVGAWAPGQPGPIWTTSRRIILTSDREHDIDGVGGRQGWRRARLGSDKPASELERAWFWVAPTADSLVLLRPAMLSEGIEFVGRWEADTLKARAHAFSDVILPGTPRANAYGIRYACDANQSAEIALAALASLQRLDIPNPTLGAAEDSVYWADIQRRFHGRNQSK